MHGKEVRSVSSFKPAFGLWALGFDYNATQKRVNTTGIERATTKTKDPRPNWKT
jgi:hypothetical protein